MYGNLPGLNVEENERVRWYLFALGNQKDLHTVHWHGNTVLDHGARVSSDVPGRWLDRWLERCRLRASGVPWGSHSAARSRISWMSPR